MNKNKEEGASKKDIVCSILLLLWLIGSLVAGGYCDKNGHESLCISFFGQVFLMIGIYGCCHFRDPKKNMLFFIIPYIGFVLVLGGVLLEIDVMGWLTIIFLVNVFTVAGVLFVLQVIFYKSYERKHITYPIMDALCINTRIRIGKEKGRNSYCPVYEIYFHGEKKTVCNHEYSNLRKRTKGMVYTIKINPDNPNELIDDRTIAMNILSLILGGAFILSGLLGTVLLLK